LVSGHSIDGVHRSQAKIAFRSSLLDGLCIFCVYSRLQKEMVMLLRIQLSTWAEQELRNSRKTGKFCPMA
jgi:hypothetical protein